MKILSKLLIEALAIACTLFVASGIIFLFTLNIGQNNYDTFTGYVSKIPLTIKAPVYGQIRALPVQEGSSVAKGQTLAAIEVLDPSTIPTSNDLYHVQGNLVSIKSPATGVVGQITHASLSTVANAETLMQLYTANSTQIQVLIPQGSDIHNYLAFFGSNTPNGSRYPLRVGGQLPANVVAVGNVPPTTLVYRATCPRISDCETTLNYNAITIYAQKPQVQSPLLTMLRSTWNGLLSTLHSWWDTLRKHF